MTFGAGSTAPSPIGRLAIMNAPDFVNSDWFAAAVMALLSWTGHKIWDRASAKTQRKIEAAVGEARSIISHLRLTAPVDTTVGQFIIWCKGAVAIQLAKVGLSTDNPLVRALVSELIADAVNQFVFDQDSRKLKVPPILGKLALAPQPPTA